jgi:hypothetical protein
MSSENLHGPREKRRAAGHLHDLGDFEQPARAGTTSTPTPT